MLKNVAGQFVDVVLLLRADGTDGTGLTPTVRIKQDGSAWGAAAGVLKEGENGAYEYAPTQTETNCNHLVIKLTEATALTALVNIYPIDQAAYRADVSAIPKRDGVDTYRTLRNSGGSIVQQIREQLHVTEQP